MSRQLTITCLILGLVFIPVSATGEIGVSEDYTISNQRLMGDNLILDEVIGPSNNNFPVEFRTGMRINYEIDGTQIWPEIAVDKKGNINVVWWDYGFQGDSSIYFTRSENDGITWRREIEITSSENWASDYFGSWPDITVDKKGNIFVVWVGHGNLYFTKSTDTGLTWSEPRKINDMPDVVDTHQPSITVYGKTIFVVWTDLREDGIYSDIYFSKSIDGGLSWTPNVRINDNLNYLPLANEPDIAANQYGIFVTWNDWRGYQPGGRFPDVYFAKSTDGGLTWTNPNIRVNQNTLYFQEDPRIAVNGQDIYIVFMDSDWTTREAWFAKYSPDSAHDQWINKRIDNSPGYNAIYVPDIAVEGNKIFVVWGTDWRTGQPYIGFTMSFDKGASWSADQLIPVPINPTAQNSPDINVFNGGIYVTWHFYQSYQTYDIYFSKGELREITEYKELAHPRDVKILK